jgi:hypothetical protein
MKHQRFYEYTEGFDPEHWQTCTADQLLFELIPTGKAAAYRTYVILLEETPKPDAVPETICVCSRDPDVRKNCPVHGYRGK